MSFTVNGGIHTKGDCVVIRHGDIEVWVPLDEAGKLGRDILAAAKRLENENRAIRRAIKRPAIRCR